MSTFSQLALQTAIYDKLSGDSTLMNMVSDIFDRPPQGSSYPYVTIGDSDARDMSNRETAGTDHRMTLHVWSREGGRAQTATIMDRLYQLLHQGELAIIGHTLVVMHFTSSAIMQENDGITYHGTMTLRVLLQAD